MMTPEKNEGHRQRTSCVRVEYQNRDARGHWLQVICTDDRAIHLRKNTGKPFHLCQVVI